jgi:hypothetical protein
MHVLNRTEGFRDLAVTPGVEGREPCQGFWHEWISGWTKGLRVLDVGDGVSTLGEDLLARGVQSVTTQDPCEWCPVDEHRTVEELAWASERWDVVTSTDVLEHIVDYGRWARALVQLADKYVIITTPGVAVTFNRNVNHYHEFYPNEVVQLFEAAGAKLHVVRFYRGPADLTLPRTEILDAIGDAARKLAATVIDVHPLGFVFQVLSWLQQ